MKLLSFIVPVYNVEQYLKRCLESLLIGDEYDYEIVIINDGSTDNSEKIVLEFKDNYPNLVKYIKQENKGLSAARNCGMNIAEGQYITFIDSDDFIIAERYLKLFKILINGDVDFIIGNYFKYYDGRIETHKFNRFKKKALKKESLNSDEYIKVMYDYIKDDFDSESVTQIYKTNFLKTNNIRFCETIIHEDTMFMFEVLSKAKTLCVRDIAFYSYRMREGSIMHSLNEKHYKSLVIISKNVFHIVKMKKWRYISVNSYLISLLYEISKYDIGLIVNDAELLKILSFSNLTFKAFIKKKILLYKIRKAITENSFI